MCNLQNNTIDEEWFGYKNVFNQSNGEKWETTKEKVKFINEKSWNDYIQENRLEVSCGEVPYLVSRYDTVTGDIIEINDRIGMLDRKMRVINENVNDEIAKYLNVDKSTYNKYENGKRKFNNDVVKELQIIIISKLAILLINK